MGALAIFAPARRLVRYALDRMHRKRLTIDALEGFRTSDFDGRIKSGNGEYGPTVSFQNSKSILFKNLAPDNLTR
jgi:hypothetical protein